MLTITKKSSQNIRECYHHHVNPPVCCYSHNITSSIKANQQNTMGSTEEEAWDFGCCYLNLRMNFPEYALPAFAVLPAYMTVAATAANQKFREIYYVHENIYSRCTCTLMHHN